MVTSEGVVDLFIVFLGLHYTDYENAQRCIQVGMFFLRRKSDDISTHFNRPFSSLQCIQRGTAGQMDFHEVVKV